jgi:hypothetical protein
MRVQNERECEDGVVSHTRHHAGWAGMQELGRWPLLVQVRAGAPYRASPSSLSFSPSPSPLSPSCSYLLQPMIAQSSIQSLTRKICGRGIELASRHPWLMVSAGTHTCVARRGRRHPILWQHRWRLWQAGRHWNRSGVRGGRRLCRDNRPAAVRQALAPVGATFHQFVVPPLQVQPPTPPPTPIRCDCCMVL